ncbi:MAG TPA: hypothetical protein VID30_15385 [Bradyrhizobium sp.]
MGQSRRSDTPGATRWDRTILMLSTTAILGLIALFIYGKAGSRW